VLNVDFGFDVALKIGWLLVYVIIGLLLAKSCRLREPAKASSTPPVVG